WSNIDAIPFSAIPWPILSSNPITSPEHLTPQRIASFILGGGDIYHAAKTRKNRIRAALLRWHPDRFNNNVLPKVVEADRSAVTEGVGKVVACLNRLL
ncbi:hypothetical protein M422DRAFT_82176, partial [Sphaerobolus stellatus SS14]